MDIQSQIPVGRPIIPVVLSGPRMGLPTAQAVLGSAIPRGARVVLVASREIPTDATLEALSEFAEMLFVNRVLLICETDPGQARGLLAHFQDATHRPRFMTMVAAPTRHLMASETLQLRAEDATLRNGALLIEKRRIAARWHAPASEPGAIHDFERMYNDLIHSPKNLYPTLTDEESGLVPTDASAA